MITFDNVSTVYPDGTVAVDNLTLTAPNGKITVLVGRRDAERRPRCA